MLMRTAREPSTLARASRNRCWGQPRCRRRAWLRKAEGLPAKTAVRARNERETESVRSTGAGRLRFACWLPCSPPILGRGLCADYLANIAVLFRLRGDLFACRRVAEFSEPIPVSNDQRRY